MAAHGRIRQEVSFVAPSPPRGLRRETRRERRYRWRGSRCHAASGLLPPPRGVTVHLLFRVALMPVRPDRHAGIRSRRGIRTQAAAALTRWTLRFALSRALPWRAQRRKHRPLPFSPHGRLESMSFSTPGRHLPRRFASPPTRRARWRTRAWPRSGDRRSGRPHRMRLLRAGPASQRKSAHWIPRFPPEMQIGHPGPRHRVDDDLPGRWKRIACPWEFRGVCRNRSASRPDRATGHRIEERGGCRNAPVSGALSVLPVDAARPAPWRRLFLRSLLVRSRPSER